MASQQENKVRRADDERQRPSYALLSYAARKHFMELFQELALMEHLLKQC